jgi:acetyltransferase-like isoleucine patch superfamily enzyme
MARRDGRAHWWDEPMVRVAWRARLIRPYRAWRFHEFGLHSVLDRPEWIYGSRHISIGERVVILRGARLSAEPRGRANSPSIVIGNGSMFRTHLMVSASTSVVIEENVLGGSMISIIDCDHTITEADHNPLWNPVITEPIRIGAGSWIGERVTVLRGSTIGRKCVVAAHSVVRGEIPDFSVAAGAPARVVGSTRPA